MWISNFSNMICWVGYPFPILYFWCPFTIFWPYIHGLLSGFSILFHCQYLSLCQYYACAILFLCNVFWNKKVFESFASRSTFQCVSHKNTKQNKIFHDQICFEKLLCILIPSWGFMALSFRKITYNYICIIKFCKVLK